MITKHNVICYASEMLSNDVAINAHSVKNENPFQMIIIRCFGILHVQTFTKYNSMNW